MAASAAQFENGSVWLAVPVAGPWLTMGQRSSACDTSDPTAKEGLKCAGDVFAVMALIMDGVAQATGATLLAIGYSATKTVLVRDDQIMRISPMPIGTGYGAGVVGLF